MSGVSRPRAARAPHAGRPGPSSRTVIATVCAAARADTQIRVVGDVCRTALSSRLLTTCSSCVWSPRTNGRSAGTSSVITRAPERSKRRVTRVDELAEVDRLHVGAQRARFDAAHAQQVRDEPIEPVGLVDHDVEQLVARRVVVRRSRAQVGRDRVDHGERCPQIVRHGAQQRASLRVDVVQRVHLRRHERARDERDRAEHDERDRVLSQADARRAERRQRERERERRGRGDDERGARPPSTAATMTGTTSNNAGTARVTSSCRGATASASTIVSRIPTPTASLGAAGRGAAPWPQGCHPAPNFRAPRSCQKAERLPIHVRHDPQT